VKDGEYVLKFKAKRNNANQGIQIFLGEKKDGKTGFLFSIGRHGSSSVVAQYYMNNNMIGYVGYGKNVAIDNNNWCDVRVSVVHNKVNISLNDEPVLNFTSQDYPRQFMSTGYDKQSGEVLIKMVNAGSKEFFTNIILDGVTKTEKTGKVILLATDSLNAENSFENPKKIAPVISSHNNFNTSFTYQFKPYSLTVLRIKVAL
jgi:alpha-L-arabinofuranosidase